MSFLSNSPRPILHFARPLLFLAVLLSPNASCADQAAELSPDTSRSKSRVDTLVPWLLQGDDDLRGIPFSEVILAATSRRVLPIDLKNESDQRAIRQISAVLDEVMKRMNEPENSVQAVPRINEVSSHFE